MHTYHLLPRWLDLPNLLRTGKPAPKRESFDEQRSFIEAMNHYAQQDAAGIAEYCLQGLPAGPEVLDSILVTYTIYIFVIYQPAETDIINFRK